MAIRRGIIIVASALLLVCAAGTVYSQPQPVPRLTERHLDNASYVELAQQWKDHIEKNGETTEALTNLAMAYDYSEELEAALITAQRAVEVGPDNAKALAMLGKMLTTYKDDEEAALKVLKRCRKVAPDYEYGLTMLATTHLRRGEFREANEVFKTVFDRRIISRPLQDYAYNMLVGLPEGAVLITGGDNDTFPPLALQAGLGFRTDVVLLNRSLLNVPQYAQAIFERNPSLNPDYNIEKHETRIVDGEPTLLSNVLIKMIMADQKAPVYFSASANFSHHGFEPEGRAEGINLRTGKKGISAEKSAQLFLESYRLDSATDWGFPWSMVPAVSKLLGNYVASMIKLAEHKDISGKTRARLLGRAAAIAEFHEMDKMSMYIETLRKQ